MDIVWCDQVWAHTSPVFDIFGEKQIVKLQYLVPKVSHIQIKVYDTSGRLVNKIIDECKSGGSYQVNWDTDKVVGGIYFIKLISDNYKVTKKLILLK